MYLYSICKNQILVGGQSIKMLDLTSLRSMFGLVGQEPVLFDTTVKENILLGKQGTKMDGDQEEIDNNQAVHIEAAKNANAHGFVSSMPEGYDTSVGKYGTINL
jgi:ATP-binding cassette subfamily B (MDR/TAP) protein 1